MLNPLLLPAPDRDERPFVGYLVLCVVLFIMNGIYDATINTTFDVVSILEAFLDIACSNEVLEVLFLV